MAATGEVDLIFNGKGNVQGFLKSLQGQLGEVSKVVSSFNSGSFLKSILSGVGIGSGAQITELIKDAIIRPFREAAELAKQDEQASERRLNFLKQEIALRRTSSEERLAALRKEAEETRNASLQAESKLVIPFTNIVGGKVVTSQAHRTPTKEQAADLAALSKKADEAAHALNVFNIQAQQLAVNEKLTDFFREVELGSKAITDAVDEKLIDFFREVELGAQESAEAIAKQNAEIAESVKAFDQLLRVQLQVKASRDDQRRKTNAGESQTREGAVDTKLTDFFGSLDKPRKQTAIQQAEGRAAGVEDPQRNENFMTVTDGMKAGLLSFISEVGSRGEQVAGTLRDVLGSAVFSISDGIFSWITGIGSAKDAAMGFLQGALRSVLDFIVKIGVQQLANAVLGRSIAAANAAANAATASAAAFALSAIWATPATLATIATTGAAAAEAPFAITAARASVFASSLAGFADGGYTGDGARYQPAGIVHRGEYVMSQPVVRRLGVSYLDRLAHTIAPRGYADGGYVSDPAPGAFSGGRGGSQSFNIYVVDSERQARRMDKNSPIAGQIINLVKENKFTIFG